MTFREAKGHLLYAFSESLINDKDFALLYVLNTLKNRDFHCWEYDWFDLDAVSEDDVYAEFRYLKNDIKRLERALWLPNEIICSFYNDLRIDSVEALWILLKRLAYPNRYSDMISRFGRPVPQLSMVVNQMMDKIDSEFGHLLRDLNQPWLSADNLTMFADAIHTKGAALNNTLGFIDGTVHPISRPRIHQMIVYNDHKWQHALKYQSITTWNGMIANLYGPVEGKRHDATMSRMLSRKSFFGALTWKTVYIWRSSIPFKTIFTSTIQGELTLHNNKKAFNYSMVKVRLLVEWLLKMSSTTSNSVTWL